jgi:predicted transcriptional regulator YheO
MGKRLDLLIQIAHGLAVQFGDSCEIVIHDLKSEQLEHSVVHIENGHVTGRKLGDGPSRVVFDTLSKDPAKIKDRLSYLTKTEDGRILKSSTMFVRGDNDTVEYIFSLNYDITALLSIESAVHSLVTTQKETQIRENGLNEDDSQPQPILHNVTDLLDSLIEQALNLVGKPVAAMNKEDKIKVVKFLNNAGAFLITKSGDRVASLLEISKFTLYNYMDAGNR